MTGSNVVPIRKPRAVANVVENAILSGRKLPLQIMLDHMWRLADEAEGLASSSNPDDAMIGRVARERLFKVAEACAVYVHPKMAATIVSGDQDNPVRHTHEDRRRFDRLTNDQAQRFLAAIESGEMTIEEVDAQLSD